MKLFHNCLVLGATQTGKTTTAFNILQNQDDIVLKIFINSKLDRNFDRYIYKSFTNATFEAMLFDYRNFAQFQKGLVYEFIPSIKEKDFKDVVQLCQQILEAHQAGMLQRTAIIVDEVHLYKKNIEGIKRLWTMGLGLGIRVIGVSQSPTHMKPDMRENSEIWVIHALSDTRLEFLEQEGFIDVPDALKKTQPDGTPYMYRYKMFAHKKGEIDHSCYVQYDVTGLRKWF